MKLLVVEDEPGIASFVSRGLQRVGYEVEWVETGRDALACATDGSDFDLVLLDLGLPDLDGLEVLAELRVRGVDVPVFILTARGDGDDQVRGLALGAEQYLTKPFPFAELLSRICARVPLTAK